MTVVLVRRGFRMMPPGTERAYEIPAEIVASIAGR
jgi:hypothetical protein